MLSIRAGEEKKVFSLQLNVGQGAPPARSGGFPSGMRSSLSGAATTSFPPMSNSRT